MILLLKKKNSTDGNSGTPARKITGEFLGWEAWSTSTLELASCGHCSRKKSNKRVVDFGFPFGEISVRGVKQLVKTSTMIVGKRKPQEDVTTEVTFVGKRKQQEDGTIEVSLSAVDPMCSLHDVARLVGENYCDFHENTHCSRCYTMYTDNDMQPAHRIATPCRRLKFDNLHLCKKCVENGIDSLI